MSQMIPPEDLSIQHLAKILEAAYFDIDEVGEQHIDMTRSYQVRLSLVADNRFVLLSAVFHAEQGETRTSLAAHCEMVNSEMFALKAWLTEDMDTVYELASFCGTGLDGKTLVRLIDEFVMMVRTALDAAEEDPAMARDDDDKPPRLLN